MSRTHLARTVFAAWAVLLAVVCIKPLLKPTSGTVYVTYATAGREFVEGRRLYDVMHPFTDNYRYSPLVAAGFAPFSLLPLGVGGMLWRAASAAVFLTGLAAFARRVCPGVPLPAVFLFALPLSFGSLYNGQANTLVVGSMLWATVLATRDRWAAAAVLVAGASLFKGYPIALGGLFVLAAPRRFGLPLAVAILAGLALPFAVQSTDYVSDQYRFWAANLSRDDRTEFPLHAGLQDVHMLLRVVGVNMPLGPYRLVGAGVGLMAAAVVGWQSWKGIDSRQVVANALTLGLCWMATFGPAVESSSFILLAPVLSRELADRANRPRWARAAAFAGGGLFLLSVGIFAFPHAVHRPVIAMGIQPIAALLLSAAAVGRVLATRAIPPALPTPMSEVPLRQAA